MEIDKKIAQLNGLNEQLKNFKIPKREKTEEERVQLIEVIKGINKYKGDPIALRNYLNHTLNELRSSNR